MLTMLETLKVRLAVAGSENDEVLLSFLDSAASAIAMRRYPNGECPCTEDGKPIIEARYYDLQMRIAAEMFARMGTEGENSHTEGDIARRYTSGSISEELLRAVVPRVGVVQ